MGEKELTGFYSVYKKREEKKKLRYASSGTELSFSNTRRHRQADGLTDKYVAVLVIDCQRRTYFYMNVAMIEKKSRSVSRVSKKREET